MLSEKSKLMRALEADRYGDWDRAHRIVQDLESPEACWIHAYLHRVEGNFGNAAYWYRRAGRSGSRISLEEERKQILNTLRKTVTS